MNIRLVGILNQLWIIKPALGEFLFPTHHNPVGFLWSNGMILVVVIAVSVLVGFGLGWLVKDWKDSAEIARVKSEKQTLIDRDAILGNANG